MNSKLFCLIKVGLEQIYGACKPCILCIAQLRERFNCNSGWPSKCYSQVKLIEVAHNINGIIYIHYTTIHEQIPKESDDYNGIK